MQQWLISLDGTKLLEVTVHGPGEKPNTLVYSIKGDPRDTQRYICDAWRIDTNIAELQRRYTLSQLVVLDEMANAMRRQLAQIDRAVFSLKLYFGGLKP